METAKVTIKGTMPLLMHADNIQWADFMQEWQAQPENKALSKAGDDRTPPWRWFGNLNCDDANTGVVTIPSEYVMRCIMEGGAMVPTGRRQQTYKSQSQSGLLCADFHWPLLVHGKTIQMAKVRKCLALKTYKEQIDLVAGLGFELFCKRAKVGASKHIRVRPLFRDWSIQGTIYITDETMNKLVLETILKQAGRFKGLGDWRPGGKTPGPYGMFEAVVE